MNFKTTLALLILAAAGGLSLWFAPELSRSMGLTKEAPQAAGDTLQIIADDFKPEKIRRLELTRGRQQVTLEGGPGREWTLPGSWPARQEATDRVIDILTHLDTRFAPIALATAADGKAFILSPYGLDKPYLRVKVTTGDAGKTVHELAFGQGAEGEDDDPFLRPTYLHIDTLPEVLRLAPGLVADVGVAPEDYQKRRVFPAFERLQVKTLQMPMTPDAMADSGERDKTVEVFAAPELTVQGPQGSYTLRRTGVPRRTTSAAEAAAAPPVTWEDIAEGWELTEPGRDHVDDKKLEAILTALPDIWAERFTGPAASAGRSLEQYGLSRPERKLRVRLGGQDTRTLLIGKLVKSDKPDEVPPPDPVNGPPRDPKRRYAKLEGNDQVFEIKADKLDSDVFVPARDVRDARVARFKPEDARRVRVRRQGQDVVLVKEQERWRLQQPWHVDADTTRVTDLLDQLSRLEARDDDVTYKDDPKYRLGGSAEKVEVTVEQSKGEGAQKSTATKTWTFVLGKQDPAKGKVYVQLEGWPRVNVVADSLLKVVQRPALAYRSRRVLDFLAADLARIEVHNRGEQYALEQKGDRWRLAKPAGGEADDGKVNQLAGDLGNLEAVEYVSAAPAKDELSKAYGLGTPGASVTVKFTKGDMPAQTLLFGKRRQPGADYFARLASDPAVFVVKKEAVEALEKGSLAYLPLQLWKLTPEEVAGAKLDRDGESFHLERAGEAWRITAPFQATATKDVAQSLVTELAGPQAERYEAHHLKDAAKYGLDKPHLRVTVETAGGKGPRHELVIGKPTAPGAKTRFARRGEGDAVFILGEKLLAAVDRRALDLLDRKLLSLDPRSVTRVQSTGKSGELTIRREGAADAWRVDSPQAKFQADPALVQSFLAAWADLRAARFVAYGDKADLASFGLDRPAFRITLSGPGGQQHTLLLGKPAGAPARPGPVERYARLEKGPGVFVLSAPTVATLTRGYLDFADPTVLKLDAGTVTTLERQEGAERLRLMKGDNGWKLVQPVAQQADGPTVEGLLESLSHVRASRVAAYRPQDLKPFGLDRPAAVLTLHVGEKGKATHVLRVGKAVAARADEVAVGDRYVSADDSPVVAVVPAEVAKRLLAPALHFRDHNLVRFSDADRAVLERGRRQAVFARVDGTWKMTSPIDAEADQAGLEDLVNALAKLRADELVVEKPRWTPADLRPFGLDRPEVRWQFQLEGKGVLGVDVGSPEKVRTGGQDTEGPRRYARLANGNLVFLLDAGLTTKVMGEYRSRTVWPALDAAQVDSLTYRRPGGSLTLERSGSGWQVAGRAELKIKPEAVTETLDALARMQAQRYVVDKDADRKLYGLEPPQLVVEVQTRNGKQVLHVGRREGDSRRYYARVPEAGRSDVFVISEADAKAIVRDLAAFEQRTDRARR
jgi:hypothetical protein